jgi:RNA polymerase sigma-70 factor (ECF subfamily)
VRTEAANRPETPLLDERRLVQKAKSGDPDAFARLYDAYVERVYRYIYFRVSDDAATEDLTSQVFLKAWESVSRYRPGSSPFLAWLYSIARNLVIDHYRTKKETVDLEDIIHITSNGPSPDEEVQKRFELQEMRKALQFLTDEQREVVTLRFIAGLSTEEVAAVMEKREGAIRALQMRALHALYQYMMEKEMI